jgi:hypothetical protein
MGCLRNLPIPASAPVLSFSTPFTTDGVGHSAEWTHTAALRPPRSNGAASDAMSDQQRFEAVRNYLKTMWRMSDAVADRFDAHIAVTARRLRTAAAGARMPKANDGTDAALTMHIAEGCFLVTGEAQLIKLVDESGTYQRPWVRRLDDLDDLPEGPPWGASARQAADAFERRQPGTNGVRS